MKIIVDWYFYTDGDFILTNSEQYNGIDVYDDGYIFSGKTEFENKGDTLEYLKKMLCDIRVHHTHYYLIEDIYRMFSSLIDFVAEENRTGEKTEYLGGNYSETEIKILIDLNAETAADSQSE